jgi:hypothetical protein
MVTEIAELSAEDQAWKDAYLMNWVGASNPVAVARKLADHTSALMRELHDTRAVCAHPALRAMVGQLAFLMGESLGPADTTLDAVKANAERIGCVLEHLSY